MICLQFLNQYSSAIQALLAIAMFLLALVIWINGKKISRTQYMQSIQQSWITFNATMLQSSQLSAIANDILKNKKVDINDPTQLHVMYMLLNILEAENIGAMNKLTDKHYNRESRMDILKPIIKNNPDLLNIIENGGFHTDFVKVCTALLNS